MNESSINLCARSREISWTNCVYGKRLLTFAFGLVNVGERGGVDHCLRPETAKCGLNRGRIGDIARGSSEGAQFHTNRPRCNQLARQLTASAGNQNAH
jgi:hypothetical protein